MLAVFTSVMEASNDTRHCDNENQWRYQDETKIVWNPHKKHSSDSQNPGITSVFRSVKKVQFHWQYDGLEFKSWYGQEFSVLHGIGPVLGCSWPPIQWIPRAHS
jgi:hypothetical protein